ncbi:MAG: VanZ family protein [Micropruina sp.]|uniref:VanZ family protein n=1 Tax=Micropruina sp. TaxID=2737536 RepID=UPI0039E3D9D7
MPASPRSATAPDTRPDAALDRSLAGLVRNPPRWLRIGAWVAFALALAAHFYGLYAPVEPGAVELFPYADKVLHFLGFAAPTTLAVLLSRHWWPTVVFAGHAVLSEIIQASWLPGRDGDITDVMADLAGVLVAVVVWWSWCSPRRDGKTRIRDCTFNGVTPIKEEHDE